MRSLVTAATLIAAIAPLGCDDPPTTPPPPPTLPATVAADAAGFDSLHMTLGGLLFIISARDLGPLQGGSSGLFADSLVGKTLVWDCNSSAYVVDTVAGAPADGIRILLYGSTDTGYPICPLISFAYYDVHDVGTVDSPRVHIIVRDTSLAVSYLDYTIQATAQGSAFSATLSGFVSNGSQRWDIAGTASGTTTSRMRSLVATHAGSVARAVIQQSENYGGLNVIGNSDTRLIHAGDTVRFAGALADGMGTLNVDVNDRPFGTVSHGYSTTTYTGPDDRPLTPTEEEAVVWLGVIGELGYAVLNDLLQPAGFLLGFNVHHP